MRRGTPGVGPRSFKTFVSPSDSVTTTAGVLEAHNCSSFHTDGATLSKHSRAGPRRPQISRGTGVGDVDRTATGCRWGSRPETPVRDGRGATRGSVCGNATLKAVVVHLSSPPGRGWTPSPLSTGSGNRFFYSPTELPVTVREGVL